MSQWQENQDLRAGINRSHRLNQSLANDVKVARKGRNLWKQKCLNLESKMQAQLIELHRQDEEIEDLKETIKYHESNELNGPGDYVGL